MVESSPKRMEVTAFKKKKKKEKKTEMGESSPRELKRLSSKRREMGGSSPKEGSG